MTVNGYRWISEIVLSTSQHDLTYKEGLSSDPKSIRVFSRVESKRSPFYWSIGSGQGWGEGSVDRRGTHCFCRGPKFRAAPMLGGLQPSLTPFPRGSSASGPHKHLHSCTHTYIYIELKIFFLKKELVKKIFFTYIHFFFITIYPWL